MCTYKGVKRSYHNNLHVYAIYVHMQLYTLSFCCPKEVYLTASTGLTIPYSKNTETTPHLHIRTYPSV